MSEKTIADLVADVQFLSSHPSTLHEGTPMPIVLQCSVLPVDQWSSTVLEQELNVTLPSDLEALWNQVSSLRLFEDVTYGQWGCLLWSPGETVKRNQLIPSYRRIDFVDGDLLIGEFLGDADLVLIRCDPSKPDFGSIVVVPPMDPRGDWYLAASSLRQFIGKFLSSPQIKFWESRMEG